MGKHYVPQEYLRAFAEHSDPDQIWMFDKASKAWRRAAIAKVAQERDYYPADVEEKLNKQVEVPANLALKQLRDREVFTSQDRAALGNYIAVMTMRVPRKRRRGYELLPEVLESTIADARELFTDLAQRTNPAALPKYLEQIEIARKKFATAPPPETQQEIENPWPSTENLNAIHGMVWRFVTPARTDLQFITSDNPAFFFDFYGVGTPDSELTFPVAPDLCLLGSNQGIPGSTLHVTGTRAVVFEANRRIAVGAERFIFHSREASWIGTLARHKDQSRLNRIKW